MIPGMIPTGGNPNQDYFLPPLNISPNTITASGYSSGSYMSSQLHVVHSSTIKGVGLISGGPYATGHYNQVLLDSDPN